MLDGIGSFLIGDGDGTVIVEFSNEIYRLILTRYRLMIEVDGTVETNVASEIIKCVPVAIWTHSNIT